MELLGRITHQMYVDTEITQEKGEKNSDSQLKYMHTAVTQIWTMWCRYVRTYVHYVYVCTFDTH